MNQSKLIAILLLALTVFPTSGDALNPAFQNKGFRIERIAPVTMFKAADGSYFIDFGKDAFGTLELKYKASKNETLTISLGEKLLNGKIDTNPGGTIRFAEVKLPVSPAKMTAKINVDHADNEILILNQKKYNFSVKLLNLTSRKNLIEVRNKN